MTLDLSDGKSVPQAYKEYYIAMLIAMRKWRRNLIDEWTTSGLGSGIVNFGGVDYWGGTFDMNHLNDDPRKIRMAELLGIDAVGRDEIHAIGVSGDTDWVYAYFRPEPKTDNPYDEANFSFVFEHAAKPHAISRGLGSVVFKSIDQVVPCQWYTRTVITVNGVVTNDTTVLSSTYLAESSTSTTVTTGTPPDEVTTVTTITTGLRDYTLHAPLPLSMKTYAKTSSSYHPNFSADNTFYENPDDLIPVKTALKSSGLGDAFASIYSICDYFEHYVANIKTVEYVKTNINALSEQPVSWVFRTHHTFSMGDYGWMSDANLRSDLYPSVLIGSSKEDDYFTFASVSGGFKGRYSQESEGIAKNLSGRIMDVIDSGVSGNLTLNYLIVNHQQSPYTWAKVYDGRLWFELAYVRSMDIKAFTHLLSLHLDINAGADDGFFGTFIGGFIGAIIKIVTSVLDVFFKVVELLDFVMKPLIRAVLKYVFGIEGNRLEKIMNAYTEIRNAVALIIVTLGIGAYFNGAAAASEATAAGASAAEVATISAMDSFMFEIINMSAIEIAGMGAQIVAAGVGGYIGTGIGDGSAAATASAVEESVRSTNPMQLVYGESDMDYVDAVYVMMDDLGMSDMGVDALSLVYS